MISELCEAFGCVPSQILREDIGVLFRILDHRAAKAAKAAMNMQDKEAGFQHLSKNQQLTEILLLMNRAQRGISLDGTRRGLADTTEAMIIAEHYRDEPEEAENSNGR